MKSLACGYIQTGRSSPSWREVAVEEVSVDMTQLELAEGMRQAMRRLAASVVVVTASDGGVRYAMAASAATSVSMDPPSMLVCVNQTASIYPVLMKRGYFCINILGLDHREVSDACSGKVKGEARFAIGDWRTDPDTQTPYLEDAQASLICETADIHQYGTHGIFIGRVKSIRTRAEVSPLVYVDARYAAVLG
jgi:flavin reductase (DIM6/NTAB) family NADH-FMN oxidoreductase RutF